TQLQTNLKVLEPSLLKAEAEQQEADTRVREATMRLEILRSKLALAGSQLHELAKVMARFGDSEADSTTQSAAKPRYEEDAEWRELNVAVTRARHRVEEARRDLTDLHPDMVKLIGRLDLAKQLLRTREVQLDRLWERRAEGPSRNGKTAREEALQDLARLDRDMSPASSDASGAGPPLVGGMPVEQHIKLVRQRLKLNLHERELLEKDVAALNRDFRSTFDSAQLLEKETRDLAHKQSLLSDVRESMDKMDMERNVPVSIEVLTRAFSPSVPSRDRRILLTLMTVFGALGAGMAVAFLRASTSQAMHGADELPRPLRAPFLGQLPLVRRGGPAFESNPLMVENMRMIRTALLSRMDEQRGSTVMISSANTGAGKSTVSVMLGRSLAEGGKRVLLIDADLRRSTLSHHFGLGDEPGLLESLTHQDGRQQTVFPTDTPRLSIMPTGQRQGSAELELMANGVFSGFVGRLSKDYDIILLDSSPILPVADARIVSRHVDGTIMVVREETSRRGDVIDALACLGSAGGKLLGTIFIGTLRGDRYGYDYYYSEADA
ncbi:MAG: polysaccharide biosynthesis tyrosine autokinase, partial [Planctomycetota bacterium]